MDVNTPGWDEKSGAGRLDILTALQSLSNSIVKFEYPVQNYSTNDDFMDIYATILSADFRSYNLEYGFGLNPDSWFSLIEKENYQFLNKNIFTLNLSNLPDSVYTLRLNLERSRGSNLEERINFFIDRTPPIINEFLCNVYISG